MVTENVQDSINKDTAEFYNDNIEIPHFVGQTHHRLARSITTCSLLTHNTM